MDAGNAVERLAYGGQPFLLHFGAANHIARARVVLHVALFGAAQPVAHCLDRDGLERVASFAVAGFIDGIRRGGLHGLHGLLRLGGMAGQRGSQRHGAGPKRGSVLHEGIP